MLNSSNAGADGSLRFAVMRPTDVAAVARIEAASFPLPWNHGHFRHELERNPYSVNRVLRRRGAVIGYASVWILDGRTSGEQDRDRSRRNAAADSVAC